MANELPSAWSCERTDAYRPAPESSSRRFATYRHESGDVAVRVAPTVLDPTERPGYELSVTVYPGLEFSSRSVVRTVTTYDRCERLAREFMRLFDGMFDRPAEAESTVERAAARLRPADAHDAVVPDPGPLEADDDGGTGPV